MLLGVFTFNYGICYSMNDANSDFAKNELNVTKILDELLKDYDKDERPSQKSKN